MGAEEVTMGITWGLSCGFVLLVVILDLNRNPLGHPKKYCRFRTVNWLICGLTYAFAYMGRYNISVANIEGVWKYYNCEKSYGTIILVGNIAYAIFVITNGYIIDIIGARNGMCIGAIGSAVTNFIMGVICSIPSLYNTAEEYEYNLTDGKDGTTFVVCMSVVYAINNFFQTFATSAICKLGVNWYGMSERGVFSGLFGVVISFGFFLAFQVDGLILGNGSPQTLPWIFFAPAIILSIFFFLNFLIVRAIPEHKYPQRFLVTLRPPGFDARKLFAKTPNFFQVLKPIFTKWIFLVLALAELCIGWNRDGVLNWYNSYFQSHFGQEANSVPYQIAATGITIGGMFGSFITGVLSDVLFNSRRPPMALVDAFCLFISLLGLLGLYNDMYGSAVMIFISAIFFNGINGIITSTAAMDFAGSEATGTAVGLLDGIHKIASACTGSLMASIVQTYDYEGWILSMMPTACLNVIIFTLIAHVVPEGYKPRALKKLEAQKRLAAENEKAAEWASTSESTLYSQDKVVA